MSTFLELGLKAPINNALTDLGYEKPTVIQEKAIPQIISSTDDLKAFAQTGTGKTAAFSLPILELLNEDNSNVQAIILSPTRELAVQIGNNIKEFSKYLKNVKVTTVYGGSSMEDQIRSLKKGSQIVVGTPGRTVDLINRRALKLGNVQWLVLDEADEMLSMGFKQDLNRILKFTTKSDRKTWLFSATMPDEIKRIVKTYMDLNAPRVEIYRNALVNANIRHQYARTTLKEKTDDIITFLEKRNAQRGIIFCRTKFVYVSICEFLYICHIDLRFI